MSVNDAFRRIMGGNRQEDEPSSRKAPAAESAVAAQAAQLAQSAVQDGAQARAAAVAEMSEPEAPSRPPARPINISRAKKVEHYSYRPIANRSVVAEEFRILRTRLQYTERWRNSLLITSCHHDEGKTSTSLNLAHFMAKRKGTKVLLLDMDIRRPRLRKLLGMESQPDLIDVLCGQAEPEEALWYSEEENLYSMVPQRGYSNATELLESPRAAELLDRLHASFDFIVVDTCPCLSTADPLVLGRMCGETLLVVRARHTQRENVEHAVQRLKEAGITTSGIILTFVRLWVPKYFARYQYYGSYYEYHEDT